MGALQKWLADKLGTKYPAVVDLVDRAVASFLIAFAAKTILADGFDVAQIEHVSWWHTAALAGVAAAVSAIKSGIMTAITGTPALLSPVSRTLRARRDTDYRPQHAVPVRPPRRPSPHPRPGGPA
jgi:hypothetical protein